MKSAPRSAAEGEAAGENEDSRKQSPGSGTPGDAEDEQDRHQGRKARRSDTETLTLPTPQDAKHSNDGRRHTQHKTSTVDTTCHREKTKHRLSSTDLYTPKRLQSRPSTDSTRRAGPTPSTHTNNADNKGVGLFLTFLTWVLLSTTSMCVSTHQTAHPQIPTPIMYPPSYPSRSSNSILHYQLTPTPYITKRPPASIAGSARLRDQAHPTSNSGAPPTPLRDPPPKIASTKPHTPHHNTVNTNTCNYQLKSTQQQHQKHINTLPDDLPPAESHAHTKRHLTTPPPHPDPGKRQSQNTSPPQINQCHQAQITPKTNTPQHPQTTTRVDQQTCRTYPPQHSSLNVENHNQPKPTTVSPHPLPHLAHTADSTLLPTTHNQPEPTNVSPHTLPHLAHTADSTLLPTTHNQPKPTTVLHTKPYKNLLTKPSHPRSAAPTLTHTPTQTNKPPLIQLYRSKLTALPQCRNTKPRIDPNRRHPLYHPQSPSKLASKTMIPPKAAFLTQALNLRPHPLFR